MTSLENGLLTQSRLILLDSPLIVFTAFTALAWTCFTNQHEQGPSKAFDPSWWFWLVATGLGLGATVSVKWVGLFTIAWVGSLTVVQLWVLIGDAKTVTPVSRMHDVFLIPWKRTKDSAETVAQALPCPCLLSDCHPDELLCGAIRSPFYMPC